MGLCLYMEYTPVDQNKEKKQGIEAMETTGKKQQLLLLLLLLLQLKDSVFLIFFQIGPLNLLMDFHLKGHPYVKSPIDMACWDILGKVILFPGWVRAPKREGRNGKKESNKII